MLDDEYGHYLGRVLRLKRGDQLSLTDGTGIEAVAEVTGLDPVTLQIGAPVEVPRKGPAIALIQAVGKRDKVDTVVRQASELGAARITVVTTERTVAERSTRIERWRSIAEDALRIAGAAHRTVVDGVIPLSERLAGAESGSGAGPGARRRSRLSAGRRGRHRGAADRPRGRLDRGGGPGRGGGGIHPRLPGIAHAAHRNGWPRGGGAPGFRRRDARPLTFSAPRRR